MPLYAYLNIPGIAGAETQDEVYGKGNKEWITLSSMDFRSSTQSEDENFMRVHEAAQARREKGHNQRLLAWAEKHGHKLTDEARKSLLGSAKKESLQLPKPASSHSNVQDLRDKRARKDAGGTLVVTKYLDATSPKLQRKCLECANYDSDQYIEGKIQLHICRHALIKGDSSSKASREIYMAYILENCLITSLKFDGTESGKLTETITFTFEIIHSCIYVNNEWDIKSWNFVTEKEAAPFTPVLPS